MNNEIGDVANDWDKSWREFSRSLPDENPVFLCLHGCYVTQQNGSRSVIDIERICEDFCPELIITLFDDIYNMWTKTQGEILSPTLEQLLMARRIEAVMGDLIRLRMSRLGKNVRHIFASVNHPVICFFNLIVCEAAVTYFSFPITQPRTEQENGDITFTELNNKVHILTLQEMKEDKYRCFLTPLAIDELPFTPEKSGILPVEELTGRTKIVDGKEEEEKIEWYYFDATDNRWPLSSLWGDEELVSTSVKTVRFPWDRVKEVSGIIKTDVGWRDRRLAFQSNDLAAVCPVPRNRNSVTRGVDNEIVAAANRSIMTYIWQDMAWDPQHVVYNKYGEPGSMGESRVQTMTKVVDSLETLIKSGGVRND